jgi:hypothetical protein
VLHPRKLLRHLQRVENLRPRGKKLFERVGKFGDILVRRTFEGVTKPALED